MKAWLLALALPAALVLGACGGPAGRAPATTQTILEYGQECAERIAEVPAFDCADGVEAAITVGGLRVPDQAPFTPGMSCDRPALLPNGSVPGHSDGQCVPGSRAQILRDSETVQISAFCRMKFHRPGDRRHYDEVDVILHSVTTGSTCWFHAEGDGRDAPLDGQRVPPPSEAVPPPGRPSALAFWATPAATAADDCGGCHDNDPFYYSPWIAQTGQVPANPFGRYASDVGADFRHWPAPRSMEIRGNTCLGCHRIGATHTCGEGALQTVGEQTPGLDPWAESWPHSHWMPADNPLTPEQWRVTHAHSLARLTACCDAVGNGAALPDECALAPMEP